MAIHTDAYVLRVSRGGVFFDKMPNSEVSWAGVLQRKDEEEGKLLNTALDALRHSYTVTHCTFSRARNEFSLIFLFFWEFYQNSWLVFVAAVVFFYDVDFWRSFPFPSACSYLCVYKYIIQQTPLVEER